MCPDAIVIGSGITGIFSAIELARRGAKVNLIERSNAPDGATTRIAGVIHTGARFAVVNPGLAEACFNEWKWWKRNMGEHIRVSDGYYLLKNKWDGSEEYLNKWASAMKGIGIPFYEDDGIIETDQRARADRAFWVPEMAINVSGALNALLNYAVKKGVNYMPRAEVTGASLTGDGYVVEVKSGAETLKLSGHVFVAAGHETPKALAPFGIDVKYKIARGSHAVVNARTGFIIEKLKAPSVGDLFVPMNGLTYIAPSLVDDLQRPVSDEISEILSSASDVFDFSSADVIGAISTYRITISEPRSATPFDYVYSNGAITIAYSANMACARRVAVSAIKESRIQGLKDGVTENYLGF